MKLSSSNNNKVIKFSLLLALVCFAVFLFDFDEDDYFFTTENADGRRSLNTIDDDSEGSNIHSRRRRLSTRTATRNGLSPPDTDVYDELWLIKPIIQAFARTDVLEDASDDGPTKLNPPNAIASSRTSPYHATNVLDGSSSTFWRSSKATAGVPEYLTIDLGIPEHIRSIKVGFPVAGNVDFELQSSSNPDDESSWNVLETVSAFTATSITFGPYADVADRYLRLYFTGGYSMEGGYPPGRYYTISYINVWREPRVVSSTQSSEFCGGSLSWKSASLLEQFAGSAPAYEMYENAGFFSAYITSTQAANMKKDKCVYAVEPNYRVRPRGRLLRKSLQEDQVVPQEEAKGVPQDQVRNRRLGIPELLRRVKDFCTAGKRDDKGQCVVPSGTQPFEAGSWGLQRISSRGRLNGKYAWINEGFGTFIYTLDTGILENHYDWLGRNVTFGNLGPSRLQTAYVCSGDGRAGGTPSSNSYHGTHVASVSAGKTYGVAKMANIQPIQVIDDSTGVGSLASIICGLDKIIQDGIDYDGVKGKGSIIHDYSGGIAASTKQLKAIINLSVGVDGRSDILDRAVEDVVALGYTTIIAAGDSSPGLELGGGNSCHFSPTHPDAIRVGALSNGGAYAINIDNEIISFDSGSGRNPKAPDSNFGECVDIWAPGDMIMGATNTGEYDAVEMSGTSVAAAFASGTAAQFLEEYLDRLDIGSSQTTWPAGVKAQMISRSEKGTLVDLGHTTTNNRVLQTTASACQRDSDCDIQSGEKCMYDGSCGSMEIYLAARGLTSAAILTPPTPPPTFVLPAIPQPLPTPSPTPAPTVQKSACRKLSSSLHVDRINDGIGINIYPINPNEDNTSVLASNWADACSKIVAGQCAWFLTGQADYWAGVVEEASYVPDWSDTTGTFSWPNQQGFAYRICRDPNSSANCHTMGDLELTDLCASHSEGDDAALLVSDFWHNWSFQQGTGYWYPLYQGRIFEQEGVCRTASTSLHVEKAFGKLEINISPVSDNSVLAPRWADACSKIGAPGQCSWFHTGQDLTWLGLQNGEASYVSVETSTAGTFSWPDIQDFAYRICRDPNSSADCKTSGDLELTTTCTSRSVGDVDAILVNAAFEHTWSYQRGSYIWYSLYQGALSSSAVWTRKKAGDVTSSQGVQFVTAGNIESIDNTDWWTYSNVNFGNGEAGQIKLRYAKPSGAGRLEIRLGNQDGTVIGNFLPSPTGGLNTYLDYSEAYFPITGGIQGIHQVTFRAYDQTGMMNMQYWELAPPHEFPAEQPLLSGY